MGGGDGMIITIPRKTMTADLIEWVAKARRDDSAGFMDGILIEDDVAISIDGRRLHYAKIPAGIVPPGNYHYDMTKTGIVLIPTEGQFPDWKRVLPDKPTECTKYSAYRWTKKNTGDTSLQICSLLRATGVNINLQFIFDLCWGKEKIEYTVSMLKKGSKFDYCEALAFDAIDRHAVIMPMMRDE